MRRWLIYLVCAFVAGLSLAPEGFAFSSGSGNYNPQTAAAWCYGLISGSGSGTGAFIQPLVQCFTDTTQGIIPSTTINFLNTVKSDYLPVVGLMFLVAVAYYGLRIMMGDIPNIKGDTIILGLKMAGIFYFLNNAPLIYSEMLGILQQLSQSISQAATSLHTSGFCNSAMDSAGGTDNSQWQNGLWQRWDCIFGYFLGFAGGGIGSGSGGFAAASIAAFLFLMIFSMSTGILVFIFGLYLMASLLFAALRFIHMYLMSVLALSFMFCLGYLLVPLLLFRNTAVYFQKWLRFTMGFVLMPVMIFGFMGMMLVALDVALFSGNYSVWCMIGGSSYCGTNSTSGKSLFSNLTQNVTSHDVYGTASGNPNIQDEFKQFIAIALNGSESNFQGASGSGGSGSCTMVWMGVAGYQCELNTISGSYTGSAFDASDHPEVARIGLAQTGLNLGNLASGAGSTCTSTTLGSGSGGTSGNQGFTYYNNCPYVEDILISILVAALLTYVMFSLLEHLPRLASDLVAQGSSAIPGMMSSPVFGQNATKGVLDAGKEGTLGASQGFKQDGIMGALKGGAGRAGDSILSSFRGGNK